MSFERSNLIIIAGPNGAGKSSLSNIITYKYGIKAFDFDKEYYALWAKYEYDPSVQAGCKEQISKKFSHEINFAFESKDNYCFETNYHTKDVLKYQEQAKRKNFFCHLVFIGLSSPELAKERVSKRVKLKGHFVPDDEIEKRYWAGLDLLNRSFSKFDKTTIVESFPDYKLRSCIVIEKGIGVLFEKPTFLSKIPLLEKSIVNFEIVKRGKGLSF